MLCPSSGQYEIADNLDDGDHMDRKPSHYQPFRSRLLPGYEKHHQPGIEPGPLSGVLSNGRNGAGHRVSPSARESRGTRTHFVRMGSTPVGGYSLVDILCVRRIYRCPFSHPLEMAR
jgi:hypothetical protein